MTLSIPVTIKATVLAVSLGAAIFAAPAYAGGSFSLSVGSGGGGDADEFIRAGLGIYALVNAIEGGGSIYQKGSGNSAGVQQGGSGNFGLVHQEGNGHNGTLQQNGYDNSYGLFQFGKGTNAHVNQNGHGGSGATFVFGW
jgi:minor curlin subunit